MHTCEHICPPHACAVMPWGGLLYFKLGVGWCSYDASTVYRLHHLLGIDTKTDPPDSDPHPENDVYLNPQHSERVNGWSCNIFIVDKTVFRCQNNHKNSTQIFTLLPSQKVPPNLHLEHRDNSHTRPIHETSRKAVYIS
jgi:hypothetical protein